MNLVEERIKKENDRKIAEPIWVNEVATFEKILKLKKGEREKAGVYAFETTPGTITFKSGNVEILYHSGEKGFVEYRVNEEQNKQIVLAEIRKDSADFCGMDIPVGKNTVRSIIEEHPALGELYKEIFLNDFDKILSLDTEREITPVPEDVVINSILQKENDRLNEENKQKDKIIEGLQKRLMRTLEFAKNVRDSIFGKFFFNKDIKKLDLADKDLPVPSSNEEVEK